jgi:hypothetical protein
VPGIIGCALLYHEGTSGNFRQPVALVGYYLLAFNFGCNPLIVSWMVSQIAHIPRKSIKLIPRSQTPRDRPRNLSSWQCTTQVLLLAISSVSRASIPTSQNRLIIRSAVVQCQRRSLLYSRYQGCPRDFLSPAGLRWDSSCRVVLPQPRSKATASSCWQAGVHQRYQYDC